MKLNYLFLFFFIYGHLCAQITISGTILSTNNTPLDGASVYLNNTTIGTITNEKGFFELNFNEGNYMLIVSFLGYKTYQKTITFTENTSDITIYMEENSEFLDEVEVKKNLYDEDWKYNLTRFKKIFLGRSKLARGCNITNEKDLRFDFDYKTNTLTAIARKPLQIKHNALGYLITYDLVEFTVKGNQSFFSGYAQYKNLRKGIRRKWKKNRQIAYKGSRMHFLRSLLNKELKKDGFLMNKFRRVANKERPSEEKIRFAREYIKLIGSGVNLSKTITTPKTTLDSAIVTLNKARLPKYRDYLYKKDISPDEIISFENNIPFLDFQDYLMVIYNKEPEEYNYTKGIFGSTRKPFDFQTSHVVLLNGKSEIDTSGIMVQPNSIFNEGYWGFEALGDMLPLDYMLQKK